MQDFVFCSPTEFVFGRNAENRVGEYLKKYGATKVFVHYGGGSVKKSGLLDRVFASIRAAGLSYVELGGIQPNPVLSMVQRGIDLCRAEKVDFLLAVGGGSVIDSLKAIGVGLTYEGNVWDFFEGKVPAPSRPLPNGVILTIPAAGSEGSKSMVITNENGLLKRGFDCEASRPVFSLLNPELTYTLPAFQTASGATDMMAHIFERYFTNARSVDLTDRLCESLLRTIMRAAATAVAQPEDYDARADLMWASTVAHNDLLSCGRIGDWSSHDLEHELSALYGVTHGAGLAVVFPAWMKYVYRHDLPRFCQFATRVFDVEMDQFNPEKTALEGIYRLERFLSSIGMPIRLKELGINDDRFDEMANKATRGGSGKIGNFMPLYKNDCKEIYRLMV
jgi:alcohol dehydrogenase YqhD (iron-dependent ADH family)